jgi:cation diffusion facilitator family transporter
MAFEKSKSIGDGETDRLVTEIAYGSLDDKQHTNKQSSDESVTMSSQDDEYWTIIGCLKIPSLRRLALDLSLYINIIITIVKLVAYVQTMSLSVLAALLDSVLDVVSQFVLNYTEKRSSMHRSSAFYPAGASRLEPIGVLTCASLMGMASFEVLKESFVALVYHTRSLGDSVSMVSFWSMASIVLIKLFLLWICNRGANKRPVQSSLASKLVVLQIADPILEALAQDHFNDILSNTIAALALLLALWSPSLWWFDPVGATLISFYIIYSWLCTGMEQVRHLTGKSAPQDFIDDLKEMASAFDEVNPHT